MLFALPCILTALHPVAESTWRQRRQNILRAATADSEKKIYELKAVGDPCGLFL
jgi:hypothetical protein